MFESLYLLKETLSDNKWLNKWIINNNKKGKIQ